MAPRSSWPSVMPKPVILVLFSLAAASALPLRSCSRRGALGLAAAATLPRPATARSSKAACGDIESCREAGEVKFAELEERKGPLTRLEDGVSYRETARGAGEATAADGDVLQVTYAVYSAPQAARTYPERRRTLQAART